jgi:hypothetical protein
MTLHANMSSASNFATADDFYIAKQSEERTDVFGAIILFQNVLPF